MSAKPITPKIIAVLVLLIVTHACSAATPEATAVPPTDTAMPTASQTRVPTKAPTSTRTPKPTPTHTLGFTDILADVERLRDEGLIPDTSGRYATVSDFNRAFAQIGWLRPEVYDIVVAEFVFKGDLTWETAIATSDTSGCGVVFAVQTEDDGDAYYYGVILDKSRIFFTHLVAGYYTDLGKSRGTGKLHLSNPATAELLLLVYDYKAYVYVNDEFIGEYALARDRQLEGYFGYGIISGTNHSYGTKCKITNARIWELDE